MDTALERASHQAKAQAGQRLVEAESIAKANSALLEAQALDIRALSAAEAPEILDYRFQTDLLDKLEAIASHLPHVVQIGDETDIDFLALARQLIGGRDATLFTPEDMAAIRIRTEEIKQRVEARAAEIAALTARSSAAEPDAEPPRPAVTATPLAEPGREA